MRSAKQLVANGVTPKESTHSRTTSGKFRDAKLPDSARSSAPNKVKVIKVYQERDALAVVQVTAATVIPSNAPKQDEELFAGSTVALYQDFRAGDPIDSILARLLCGITNMTMDALARGARSNTLVRREMELKSATKGALVVTELTRAYDARRGRTKQTVNVGQVNVEAGGQAVVGNVAAAKRSGEVSHPTSPSQTAMEVVGNTTSEMRLEGAAEGMSVPQPKIEDPGRPKK
jgi:hypothetical protein